MKHIITVSILFILSLLQTIQAKGKDEYWYTPKASPEERKESFLKYYAEHGRKDFLTGIFNQIARVAIGQPMEDEPTYKAVALVRSNRDCNDFSINGMLRLLYMDREKTVIPAHLKKEIEAYSTLNTGGTTDAVIRPTGVIIRKTIRHSTTQPNCLPDSSTKTGYLPMA